MHVWCSAFCQKALFWLANQSLNHFLFDYSAKNDILNIVLHVFMQKSEEYE